VIEPALRKASDGPLLSMPEVGSCSPALTSRKAGVASASAVALVRLLLGCRRAVLLGIRADITNWSTSSWVSGARTR
jgi:hypothetical protein